MSRPQVLAAILNRLPSRPPREWSPVWAPFMLVVLITLGLVASDGQAATRKKKASERSAKPAATKAATPARSRDGEAEARLIAIYRLIAQARTREALAQSTQLVADHPNFQLAQLVHGDLLSAQARPLRVPGDVPDTTARAGGAALAELRDEAQLRLKALRERPPEGHVPAQFIQLSAQSRHAIAVDASKARLYLFENSPRGLKLVADYYISVGKAGIDKNAEGDLRTPIGLYFVTSNLDPKSLKDFYGSGALPINYPNPVDLRQGRTGSGIWLHGTPPTQFARAPKATDGCVVLANPDLERVIRTVQIRSTPVVIAPSLQWVAPGTSQLDRAAFDRAFDSWLQARSDSRIDDAMNAYAADFRSGNRGLGEWRALIESDAAKSKGRTLQVKDLSLLAWKDFSATPTETVVVTFGELREGARTGVTRRQYWQRLQGQWKIIFEGVIG